MFSRVELKEAAKAQLKGRWGDAAIATLLLGLVLIATALIAAFLPIFNIVSLLVGGPIYIGGILYCFALIKSPEKVETSVAFKGFNMFAKAVGMYLWNMLWVLLWCLLLYVPGIVKAISYSQCFYIIAENPNIQIRDALKISMRMTKGYKWEIFVMYLSFIGWSLLCCLTLYIGFLWLYPYMQTSLCNMYFKLKELSLQSGACTPADFGMQVEEPSQVY